MKLYIDLETRSAVDLPKSGQYVYADDPSTSVTVAAWSIDAEPVQSWLPLLDPAPPEELIAALFDPAVQLCAHNASFERVVLSGAAGRRLLGPDAARLQDLERWDCTAARAAVFGLPRTLDGACNALNLAVKKDKEGAALMRRMMRPDKKTGLYREDAESFGRLAAYCRQDVVAEIGVDLALPHMPPAEVDAWRTTEAMNDRGVAVDTALLLSMTYFIEDAEREINGRIYSATGGAVPRVTDHGALTRWLVAQGIDDAAETGVGKAALAAMLENTEIEPLVREVLVMRREGGKSSAAKFGAITRRLSQDGRLRGALVFCGAASTKRWSSRGAQLQNMPRGGSVADVDGAVRDVKDGATLAEVAELHGPPLVVASELIRPVFVAQPDSWLARGDYSQIEARVLAWIAGESDVLEAYRAFDAGTGPDLYRLAASKVYAILADMVTKQQRQIGKVAELACGFQGWIGAFQAMARAYGVKLTDDAAAEIVGNWRRGRPGLSDPDMGLWKTLERAAVACMDAPPGPVRMLNCGVGFGRNENTLAMRLPSGGTLFYWWPRVEWVKSPWGMKRSVVYFAEDAQTKRWTKFAAYGGLWTENAVQATARDIMRDALTRGEAVGLRPVLTVHDEGVFEVPRSVAATQEEAAALVRRVLLQPPAWAPGLPIACDSSAGPRYVKA